MHRASCFRFRQPLPHVSSFSHLEIICGRADLGLARIPEPRPLLQVLDLTLRHRQLLLLLLQFLLQSLHRLPLVVRRGGRDAFDFVQQRVALVLGLLHLLVQRSQLPRVPETTKAMEWDGMGVRGMGVSGMAWMAWSRYSSTVFKG